MSSLPDLLGVSVPEALEQAMDYHREGQLQQAEALYQKILSIEPQHPDALHLLGLISHQSGQHQVAVDLISQAIASYPSAQMFCNLGVVLQALGRMQDAEESFMSALQINPDYIDAYYNCGVTLHEMGKFEMAVEFFQQALNRKPDYVQALIHMGASHHAMSQYDAAIECCHRAITYQPMLSDAYFNLGNALKEQNHLDAALENYKKALAIDPNHADAHYNLGLVMLAQGKQKDALEQLQLAASLNPLLFDAHLTLGNIHSSQGKLDEALADYQRAIAIKPDNEHAYHSVGNVHFAQHAFEQAIKSYETAVQINPSCFEALNSLGLAYFVCGDSYSALKCCKKSIEINPDYALAYSNLGLIFQGIGDLKQSTDYYRRSISIDSDNYTAHSNLIFAMDMNPVMDLIQLQHERKQWAQHHADILLSTMPHKNMRDPDRKLRIGYISADFKRHSAACVFMSMLQHFDSQVFEVYAYNNTPKEDENTQLVQDCVTYWKNIIGLSDNEVTALIREDEIDILIDLSGHSGGNRLLVFARKPAPIQITAWGYIGGTGMKAMDVFFADPVVVPPEEKHLYAEQVVYLPNVVCYSPPGAFPAVSSLPALSGAGLTFGSFNRLAKVTQETFEVWAKVLLAVPNSRMILKTAELDQQEERDRLLQTFSLLGILPERIVLQGKSSWTEHMAAFNQVDIALDPFPHGGGVTTLEGIMMGVPVVTLRWPTIPGRISAAVLTPLGLTDWIADTPEQYVDVAVKKASDLMALAVLRKQLRKTMTDSLVGNPKAYAQAVEQQYRLLWKQWCRS